MNNSNIRDNNLRDLFNQLPLEEPGFDFDKKVMDEINLHVKKQHSLSSFTEYFTMSISAVLLITLLILVFKYLKLNVTFINLFMEIEVSSTGLSTIATAAFLLLIDSLIRKKLNKAKD